MNRKSTTAKKARRSATSPAAKATTETTKKTRARKAAPATTASPTKSPSARKPSSKKIAKKPVKINGMDVARQLVAATSTKAPKDIASAKRLKNAYLKEREAMGSNRVKVSANLQRLVKRAESTLA